MYPLPAHTVELVLQYISPLTDSLPPHLVSTPLQQRHHFLQISPSSPADYLCWPCPDSASVIDLLDHLPPLSGKVSYPTCYTSDLESTFAHVQISSTLQGLRMLFHWDSHAWKYHDLRLMPFPSFSFSTPQESLAGNSAYRPASPLRSSSDPIPEPDQINSDSDSSYWDSYEAPDDDLPPRLQNISIPDLVGEDAYWAQYASVQGSADSTVPSPLPVNRKLRPIHFNDDQPTFPLPPQSDTIIDVQANPVGPCSQLGPPSPNMLANLLSTISPGKDTCYDDAYSLQTPSTLSTDPSPEQTTADSELATPPFPDEYLDAAIVSPVSVEVNGVPVSQCHSRPLCESEDKALTESIKGLYHLWKSGRKGELDEGDRNVFLRIVQEAVAYE